jgi:hypothetical protein
MSISVGVARVRSGWVTGRMLMVASCALLLIGACGQSLSQEECFKLLEHYTDKQIDQARPSTRSADRSVLLEQARTRAATDPEFATCRTLSRSAYDCAMAADSADAIERCLL